MMANTNNLQKLHAINAHRAAFVADAARLRRAQLRNLTLALEGARYEPRMVNGLWTVFDRLTFTPLTVRRLETPEAMAARLNRS